MLGRQLDLFSAAGLPATDDTAAPVEPSRLVPGNLDDSALVVALPGARVTDCHALCAEAGRRRLIAAVPALAALCRRFKGFGLEHAVPEQIAALRSLAAIGTREAAAAVSRIIAESVVQGPGLHDAVRVAVLLECRLPPAVSLPLLRHNDARVRAAACRVARPHAEVMPVLVDLLDDLHRLVAVAAACALGRAGRIEAQPVLARLLRDEPSAEVIDAVSSVADDDCIVQLGRIARTNPVLSAAAIDALDAMDSPRAQAIAATVHGTA
jgi:HEAT repeat protein